MQRHWDDKKSKEYLESQHLVEEKQQELAEEKRQLEELETAMAPLTPTKKAKVTISGNDGMINCSQISD